MAAALVRPVLAGSRITLGAAANHGGAGIDFQGVDPPSRGWTGPAPAKV